jgi:hypothetical protein
VGVAWSLILLASLVVAPRLMEGYGALLWTRFHAARASGPHPGEHARKAGRAAARTIDLVAPLPWAREAAHLAMDAAGGLESQNRPSAISAYDDVRAALERATSSRFRGFGLGATAEEAGRKDEDARAAAEPHS